MYGARPLREPRRQNLLHILRGKLAHQPDGLSSLCWRSCLQCLQEPLCRILSQVADNRGEQFAILAESAVSESIGYVMDRGLGHQVEDLHHPVRELPAAHRFFNEFRQSFLRADAWPQALRRSRPLRLHVLQ